jgi:hypothetical protein
VNPKNTPVYLGLFNAPWIKIRRAALLRDHPDVRFKEERGLYFGDISFWTKELFYADTFVLSDTALVNYRVTHTNSTNKINKYDVYFKEFHEVRRFLAEHNAHGSGYAKMNAEKTRQTLEWVYNELEFDKDTLRELRADIDRYLSEEKALGNY